MRWLTAGPARIRAAWVSLFATAAEPPGCPHERGTAYCLGCQARLGLRP